MKPSKPLKELIIIAAVFIAIWLFVWVFISHFFGNRAFDINIHDTYIIVQSSWLESILPPFLWLITIIYLIRARINQFKNRLQNSILLISCFGLNILMLTYLELAAKFVNYTPQELTIYPPLSKPDHIAAHRTQMILCHFYLLPKSFCCCYWLSLP